MAYYQDRRDDDYEETDTRVEETTYTTDYDRGYERRDYGPRDDEYVSETTTYYSTDRRDDIPPPPQVPFGWRAHWDDRETRYIFINEDTGERTWDFPRERRSDFEETTTTTTYYDDDRQRRGYGEEAVIGGAGLAGGAYVADDVYRREEYRQDDSFTDDAARWAGRKVGEVEDIPEDIVDGFDRFGNKIRRDYDDVVDAPEEVANWAGRKVGDVERYGDNIDNAYDEGKYEGRSGW